MDEEEDEEDLYVADAEYLIVLRVGTRACFFSTILLTFRHRSLHTVL